ALQVDDAGAGVIDRAVTEAGPVAELREPAAAPDPAAEDRVDERADTEAEKAEALPAPALGARAGDDRRRRVHEDHHEEEPDDDRGVTAVAGEEEPGRAEDAPAVVAVDGRTDREHRVQRWRTSERRRAANGCPVRAAAHEGEAAYVEAEHAD